MELSEILQAFGILVTLFSIGFSYHKWRETVTHSRIDKLKSEMDKKLEEMQENIVHRDEFNALGGALKDALNDIKAEQHRMTSRFDEFFMKFIDRSLDKK